VRVELAGLASQRLLVAVVAVNSYVVSGVLSVVVLILEFHWFLVGLGDRVDHSRQRIPLVLFLGFLGVAVFEL